MDLPEDLLRCQSGVIARWQLADAGCVPHDLKRFVRRRDLVPLARGVFINHTGEPTWTQHAWAAVLSVRGSALWGPSALRAFNAPSILGPGERLHLALDRKLSAQAPEGAVLHYVADLGQRSRLNLSPPRMKVEEAVLDAATLATSEQRVVAVLADALQTRLTTADRIRNALSQRTRYPRRRFVDALLADLAAGTHSVLEHAYLTRVERAHGLPSATRQKRESLGGKVTYSDALYLDGLVVIELDGRLFHDNASAHEADLERDLAKQLDNRTTVRLGYGQVIDHPCRTALRVGRILAQHGWGGQIKQCPNCQRERP